MTPYSPSIALWTRTRREVAKIFRVWPQTLLPTAMTTALYFTIFGGLIGERIGTIDHVSYSSFIAPGLIMLSVITNSYGQVSSSFYFSRFIHYIEEMLVSPMSDTLILFSYILGGMARGIMSAILVGLVSLCFVPFTHTHLGVLITVALLTTLMFSLLGFINGLYANNFDDISIIPTFVLTPLTYLGGVFYSVNMLSPSWQTVAHLNPVLYIVNVFRYGMIGMSDVPVTQALIILSLINVVLFVLCYSLMKYGRQLRQ